MPKLPPGTLMQRAAAGLAAVCARLLSETAGGVYGSTVVVLAGPGDNGGDAMYAAARLAARGARVRAVPVMGDRIHPLAAAALTRAGGRLTVEPPPNATCSSTASSASAAAPDCPRPPAESWRA
ncbi:hypothetical protein GCM10029992_16560 [Glycomyces albus]